MAITPDMNTLMQKAKEMQDQMQQAQKQISSIKVEGTSGNGLVKVLMRGDHYVDKIEVSPTLVGEDEEMVADLCRAAVNDAVRKLEEETRGRMMDLAKNFQMPEGMEGLLGQDDGTQK